MAARRSQECGYAAGFAAETRPQICNVPTAIQCATVTKSPGLSTRGSPVDPGLPDLAAAARRLSASQRTYPHVSRSDRTPSPGRTCAARRKGPDHRLRGSNRVLLRATVESRPDVAYSDAARAPMKSHEGIGSLGRAELCKRCGVPAPPDEYDRCDTADSAPFG